jgi:hypothetical protein
MDEKSYGDKREYFRVHTRVRVGMRVVRQAEVASLAADIVHREPMPPSRIDPELAAWIGRIERKLDAALVRLGAAAEADVLAGAEELITLSGNGLLLPGEGKVLERGTTALVELTLPELAIRRIRALCTVPRDPRPDDEGGIPLTFTVIHESDRDAIIRHCLAVQRSEMRRSAAKSGGE